MVNFMNIASKIVRALPKTEGAAGKITLGRTQLEALGKQDKKAGALIQKALRGTKDPKLDVAYKAESNYAIAGMRLRDGKQVIGNGAVSITNPGTSQAVVKYRASSNGGKTLQANGFIDAGKIADGQDMAVSMSRKGGMLKGDVQIGEATAHRIKVNEQDFIDTASALNGDELLKGYVKATNELQTNLNKVMTNIRKALRGDVQLKERFDGCKVTDYKPILKERFDYEKQTDLLKFYKDYGVEKNFTDKYKKVVTISKEGAELLKKLRRDDIIKKFNLNEIDKTKPNFD